MNFDFYRSHFGSSNCALSFGGFVILDFCLCFLLSFAIWQTNGLLFRGDVRAPEGDFLVAKSGPQKKNKEATSIRDHVTKNPSDSSCISFSASPVAAMWFAVSHKRIGDTVYVSCWSGVLPHAHRTLDHVRGDKAGEKNSKRAEEYVVQWEVSTQLLQTVVSFDVSKDDLKWAKDQKGATVFSNPSHRRNVLKMLLKNTGSR